MSRIISLIVCTLAGVIQPFLCAEDVAVEFRLAETHPRPGLRAVTVPGSREPVYLHQEVALADTDIASAQVVTGAKSVQVEFLFTPTGTKKLAKVTKTSVGRRLAILINGSAVSAPTIQAPIDYGRVVVSGLSSEREARRIVNSIHDNRKRSP